MKKQWKSLLILGVVIAALLLTWLLATILPGIGQNGEETTATTAVIDPVIDIAAADVDRIQVASPADNNYTLTPVVSTENDTETVSWVMEDTADYVMDTDTVDKMGNSFISIAATKEIAAQADDLAPYGLDQPATTLVIHKKDGSGATVLIGNELTSGTGYYATLEGSGRICSISSTVATNAGYTLLNLLDKDQPFGIELADVTRFVFDRSRDNLHLVSSCEIVSTAAADGSAATTTTAAAEEAQPSLTFTLEEPIHKDGNATALNTLTTGLTGMTADGFVELAPTDLSAYGLDAPTYSFELGTADTTWQIKLGKTNSDGLYYAMTNSMDAVFTVDLAALTTLDAKVTEMMDTFLALESITKVSKIEANIDGTPFTAEIVMEAAEKADDDAVRFTLNGKDAKIFSEDDKSLFSQFYQSMIGIMLADIDPTADPVNTHDSSITYYLEADDEAGTPAYTKVVEFSRRDEYTDYVFIDGQYTGFYVDHEEAFTRQVEDDEGVLIAYKKLVYAMEHAVDGVFNTEEGYQID